MGGYVFFVFNIAALHELGAHNDGLVKEIFNSADTDDNRCLDFQEFLVVMAMAHVLGVFDGHGDADDDHDHHIDHSDTASAHKAFNTAFEIVCGSYLMFDKDCDGVISKDEVFELMGGGI